MSTEKNAMDCILFCLVFNFFLVKTHSLIFFQLFSLISLCFRT
ncbi:unnamed protein product [Brassica napus]|uniref:(rape) hypothetical protein n=1 Tax=Brassica napus TaxID=3708 RepID=A0A816SWT2_BRANA|nr:unnamed protein product [Brassica napus]